MPMQRHRKPAPMTEQDRESLARSRLALGTLALVVAVFTLCALSGVEVERALAMSFSLPLLLALFGLPLALLLAFLFRR